ncbi:MAG: DUF2188 domain-containing protein [Candidatus Nanohalobium sp.]
MTVQVLHDSTGKYGDWKVKKGRKVVSNHRKKSAAVRKMKQVASDGEKMIVQKKNGRYADGYPAYRNRG